MFKIKIDKILLISYSIFLFSVISITTPFLIKEIKFSNWERSHRRESKTKTVDSLSVKINHLQKEKDSIIKNVRKTWNSKEKE